MTVQTEQLNVVVMGCQHGVSHVRHRNTHTSAFAVQPTFAALHSQSPFRSAHCGTWRADSATMTARDKPLARCTLLATYKCTLKLLKAFPKAHHARQTAACAVAVVG